MELDEHNGSTASAKQHRDLSQGRIGQLANSLAPDDPLRIAFLSAPAIVKILGSTSAG
jgi:hypothetical protein